jgi:hypothetical protein
MRVFAFTSVIWLAVFGHLMPAQSRTLGGYVCSHECELHSAGLSARVLLAYHHRSTRDAFRILRIRLRSGRRRSGKFAGRCCRAADRQMINRDQTCSHVRNDVRPLLSKPGRMLRDQDHRDKK